MIAAQHQRYRAIRALDDQRLHGLRCIDTEQLANVVYGFGLRRLDFLEILSCCRPVTHGRICCSRLDIRCVIIGVAVGDGILARVGNDMKFLRLAAADFAAIGPDNPEFEAEALEDGRIGIVHLLVRNFETVLVDVERVRVFHDEFTRPHHAEARANLVAELGLNLVEIDRQLLVAA